MRSLKGVLFFLGIFQGLVCNAQPFEERLLTDIFPNDQIIGLADQRAKNINLWIGSTQQDVKRSVVQLYNINSNNYCSGNLVNTAAQDGKLYILTAAHCLRNQQLGDETDWWLSFNYEISHATERGNDQTNANLTRVYRVPLTVKVKRVGQNENVDIALLEVARPVDLRDATQPFYEAYAAGWNKKVAENKARVNISHSMHDLKKLYSIINSSDVSYKDFSSGVPVVSITRQNWIGGAQPEKGSSGSGLLNSNHQIFAVTRSANPTSGITQFPYIDNAWLSNSEEDPGLIKFLDPSENWISSIPGGYLKDVVALGENQIAIPLNNENPGYQTPGPDPGAGNVIFENVVHVDPRFVFPIDDTSNLTYLGIKALENPDNVNVYLTVHALEIDANNTLVEKFLYGAKSSSVGAFQAESWDCTDTNLPQDLQCNTGPLLSPLQRSTDFSRTYFGAAKRASQGEAEQDNSPISLFEKTIPVIVRLLRLDQDPNAAPVNVQAIGVPGMKTINALELFKPDEFNPQFQSDKYHESRGSPETEIYIDTLGIRSREQPEVDYSLIATGHNGGYLNLINPNYTLGPFLSSEQDNPRVIEIKLNVNNPDNNPLAYSIWIDYDQQVDDNGNYNFNQTTELVDAGTITGANSDQFTLIYTLPVLPPGTDIIRHMRVSIRAGSQPPNQNDTFEDGEVEDYLIRLKGPECNEEPAFVDASKFVNYCGVYLENLMDLEKSFERDPDVDTDEPAYKVRKVFDLRYASAKAIGTWYESAAAVPRNGVIDGSHIQDPYPVDPSANTFDPDWLAVSSSGQESDPGLLVDQDLKMDVYHPIPQIDARGQIIGQKALPLIIYLSGGGFIWNTRKSAMTEEICRWLASKGNVVAAIDYRVGFYPWDKEINRRSAIRAWQDSRAAVKWWSMEQNKSYSSDIDGVFQQNWIIDQDQIYVLGHSSGGITSLHNGSLTADKFEDEVIDGGFLEAIGAGYNFDKSQDGSVSLSTYDLSAYEPIPCLVTESGINTCDEVDKGTDGNYGKYLGDEQDIADLITDYNAKVGQADKVLSLAGAIAQPSWVDQTNIPIGDIHHIEDEIVSASVDYPYYEDNKTLPWGWTGWFPMNRLDQLFGGWAIKNPAQGAPRTNFEYWELNGGNEGGGDLGDHHYPRYDPTTSFDLLNPVMYLSVMYYIHAFFMKDWSVPTLGSSSAKTVLSTHEEASEEAIFSLFPNPTSNYLNVLLDQRLTGDVRIAIVSVEGKEVYTKSYKVSDEGYHMLKLTNLNLASGSYVVTVTNGKYEHQERLLINQ